MRPTFRTFFPRRTHMVSALLLLLPTVVSEDAAAQSLPAAALASGEPPAAGLLYTEPEKQLARAFAAARNVQNQRPTSLEIWCGDQALCEQLKQSAGGLAVRPTTRVVPDGVWAGKLGGVAAQFAKGAPKQRPKLSLSALKESPSDGVTVLAAALDKGTFYLVELVSGKGASSLEVVSVPVSGARDQVAARFRDVVSGLLSKKKRTNDAAALSTDLRSPFAAELAWNELKEQTSARPLPEGLASGGKENLASDSVLTFDAQRCSLLALPKGKGEALERCVAVGSLRTLFPSVDPSEVRAAGSRVDLPAEGLVPPAAQQGGYRSDVSWALGHVAYVNLLTRAKQSGLLSPEAATNVDAMRLHNLAKYKKAGKGAALTKSDAGKLKTLLSSLDNSQANDVRGCFGGTSIPQLLNLITQVEPAVGEGSSCGAGGNVQLRSTGALLSPELVQPRVIDADLDALRAALLMRTPVIVSAPTALFDSYQGGVVSAPPSARDTRSAATWANSFYNAADARGHHAVAVVGFDNQERTFKLQNSWGPGWGEGGTMRVHYDVFRAWFHDVAYYFDCVGPCAQRGAPTATMELSLAVDYRAIRDPLSAADPLVRVRKNGGLICELTAQESSAVQGQCGPEPITPTDVVTLELWEQDSGSSDYLGGIRLEPITGNSSGEFARFGLRGTSTISLRVPKEVKSLFKEGTPITQEQRGEGRRGRTTAAPTRPGAERKK